MRGNLKASHISGPGPEYDTFRTQTSFANHNTMNFGNAEYLSRASPVLFLHFYSELIMTASAKGIEWSLLTNPREFFYLCAEREIKEEMRLEADRP